MVWVILAIVGLGVLGFVLAGLSRRRTPTDEAPTSHALPPDLFRPPAPARGAPSRLSAAEVLSRVDALRNANAQWDTIWSQLNPTGDPEIQQFLIEIRGPHLFVPHLGLGVIKAGCERVLASSPSADSLAALREAIRSADPFVR